MNNILVIDHKSAGCSNNIQALALALSLNIPNAPIDVITCKLRSKILIPFLKMILACKNRHKKNNWLRFFWPCLFKGAVPPKQHYSYVFSTLGPGEAAGVAAARLYNAKLIHIGTPRRMPRRFFDFIVTNPGVAPKENELCFLNPPSRVALMNIEIEAAELKSQLPPPHNYDALLLGGPAAGVEFTDTFWDGLFSMMQSHSLKTGRSWLVATSPRTPVSVVTRIKSLASQSESYIADINIFEKGGQSRLPAYIGAGQSVYVTAESVSMLADALTTKKEVIALTAKGAIQNDRINGFLQTQDKAGNISFMDLINPAAYKQAVNIEKRKSWVETFLRALKNKGFTI